nr:alanine--glyoxylate aminotransferase [Helicoverpa armigera]XP_049694471.1 alanine--glyoxylate aminotransferase [Helicoverpa armigera]
MSSNKFIVPPPRIVDREVVKPLLCGPGPCDYWPSVAEALSKPVLTPICDEFFSVLDDIRAGLQYVFQTRSKLVLAMSGSGHSGMEAVISNLVGRGETLLIASRGIWDQRANIIANRYGIKVETVSIPMNVTFSAEQLEPELKRLRPTAMFITHGDSSTGTLQNLQGLGDLCHKYGTLLLVDTVVTLGAVPFFMDEWGVDGAYTSTQKAFSGPAGITPVAFSARAEEKIKTRKHDPPFYFDIKLLASQWNCYGSTRTYHHTMSPPLFWALRCCLQEIAKETLPASWARHEATTTRFHKRLREYSFEFLVPKPEDRLATVTTVVLPKGYDYMEFVKSMRARHNILIFAGLGPTVGKALRIGLMGVNSTIQVADAVAEAMADTLRVLKKSSL